MKDQQKGDIFVLNTQMHMDDTSEMCARMKIVYWGRDEIEILNPQHIYTK